MPRLTPRRLSWLAPRARRSPNARPSACFRPALEPLESRVVPYAVTEISITLANSNPLFMAAGPDGNLWFTQRGTAQMAGTFGGTIGRITPGGKVTQFPLGTFNRPLDITAGPDGNLWFTEAFYDIWAYDRVARITPGGAVTEFSPPSARYGNLGGIAAGPDGNLWFTVGSYDQVSPKIGRLNPVDGAITEFALSVWPRRITAGPDGALWFTYTGTYNVPDGIGRISTAGSPSFFSLPAMRPAPYDITPGPDGALWFTESAAGRVGRITTAGALTEYTVAPYPATPTGIRAGADGDLYVSFAQSQNTILRLSTAGTVVRGYNVPTAGSSPLGLALGPDNEVWFAEGAANKLGRLSADEPVQRLAGDSTDLGLTLCASNYG